VQHPSAVSSSIHTSTTSLPPPPPYHFSPVTCLSRDTRELCLVYSSPRTHIITTTTHLLLHTLPRLPDQAQGRSSTASQRASRFARPPRARLQLPAVIHLLRPSNQAYTTQQTLSPPFTLQRTLNTYHPAVQCCRPGYAPLRLLILPAASRPHSGDQIPRKPERPANPLHPSLTLPLVSILVLQAATTRHPPWATARPRTPARTHTTLPAGAASPPLPAYNHHRPIMTVS
jgi:hypothetical protein